MLRIEHISIVFGARLVQYLLSAGSMSFSFVRTSRMHQMAHSTTPGANRLAHFVYYIVHVPADIVPVYHLGQSQLLTFRGLCSVSRRCCIAPAAAFVATDCPDCYQGLRLT